MSAQNPTSGLRVLMVSDVNFPRINGVSTSIQTFREGLAAHGVDVHIIAPRYGNEPDDSHITRIPARKVPRDPEDRLLPWRLTHKTVAQAAQHCDLIHIQTPFVAHYAGLHAARGSYPAASRSVKISRVPADGKTASHAACAAAR